MITFSVYLYLFIYLVFMLLLFMHWYFQTWNLEELLRSEIVSKHLFNEHSSGKCLDDTDNDSILPDKSLQKSEKDPCKEIHTILAYMFVLFVYVCVIEPCFGIGHNLSLICLMTSEDIKHQLIIMYVCKTPGKIKRREVSWTLTKKLDLRLWVQARSGGGRWCWTFKKAQKISRAGRWSWAQKVGTCLLLELFLNSSATDIVLVTAPHSSWNSGCVVHYLLCNSKVPIALT